MSNTPPTTFDDAMKAWRDWFIQNEREWSEAMTHMMKNDDIARTIGQRINAALYSQNMFTQNMAAPYAMLNMPTRQDVIALGERLGKLEDAVAKMEATLVQLRHAVAGAGADTPRTRTEVPVDDVKPAG